MQLGSATDWNVNSAFNYFRPNIFIEVGKEGVEAKEKALAMYRGVMRPYPHPRSNEAIEGLAAWRGSQMAQTYSEAFECAFRRIPRYEKGSLQYRIQDLIEREQRSCSMDHLTPEYISRMLNVPLEEVKEAMGSAKR